MHVMKMQRRILVGAGLASLLLSSHALAQQPAAWPARPIKLIVAGPPGSGMDIYARMLQVPLQTALQKPVVIENKAGANGLIGNDSVAKSAADGYTFLFTPSSSIVLNPIIQAKMPYDTVKDLLPVAQVGQSGALIVANPKSGFKNLSEMVAYVKAHPGKVSYGSWGSGSTGHLAMEAIKQHYGLDMPHVPYKGTAALLNDLLGNNITVGFTDIASPIPHIKASKLVAVGITGSKRGPALPELPTVTEQGFKFDADGWYGMFAPGGTPKEIVQRMNAEVNKILQQEDTHQKFLQQNMPVPPIKTAEEFAATVHSDLQLWQGIGKKVSIQLD